MPPVAGKVSSAECTTLPVGSTRELRERDVLGLIPSTMAQRSRNTDRAAIESPSMNTHQVHGPVEQSKSVLLAAIRRHNGKDYFPLRQRHTFSAPFWENRVGDVST